MPPLGPHGWGALGGHVCCHDEGDLCQAMLEGIALCTSEVIAAMTGRVNVTDRLSVDGGLGRNVYFVQFLADVLERTIVTQRFHELTRLAARPSRQWTRGDAAAIQ